MIMEYLDSNDVFKGEAVYLAAYGVIKKMLREGVINKDSFDRLNARIALKQNTKPITA